ncbi:MAG TPA: hypothetical protein VGG35_21450 [Streptosporangiaceae bacterium]
MQGQVAVMRHRLLESPPGAGELLRRPAQRVLTGHPPLSVAQQLQLAADVTSSDVARQAGELLGTLVVRTPQVLAPVRDRMPSLAGGDDEPVAGTSYRAAAARSGARLTVGSAGVMAGTGQRRTVRWPDVALLVRWADGLADVAAAGGPALRIDSQRWKRGKQAIRAIEALVGPELIVAIDEQGPPVTWPPRPAGSARRQYWQSYLRASWLVLLALIAVTVLGRPLGGGPIVVILISAVVAQAALFSSGLPRFPRRPAAPARRDGQ